MSNYPPFLLRFFDKEDYAQEFLEGKVRFGLLTYYKKIEGARGGDKEGEASFFWNKAAPQVTIDLKSGQIIDRAESDQKIQNTVISINRRYILSTSHPEADIKKLGKLVAAQEPKLLEVFPKGTEEERNRFELLRKAYVDARYDEDYEISREELEWLGARVKKLQKLTEDICTKK